MKMQPKQIKILAIETSCDETSAAVICDANYCSANSKFETLNSKKILNSKSQIQKLTPNSQQLIAPVVLSNIVSSQVDLHKLTGGVVPEVASRAHVESIIPVIREALFKSKIKNKKSKCRFDYFLEDITHIAVTNGPGLVGSLLVGVNTARTLAYALNIPIVPINHIEGHIYSAFSGETLNSKLETLNKSKIQNHKSKTLTATHLAGVNAHLRGETNTKSQRLNPNSYNLTAISFPVLALTVSGGHTSLTLMRDHGKYETIGQTRDDAAGEAFDKVAKLLDLGYPGGPAVSKLAEEFRNKLKNRETEGPKNKLPRPMIDDESFDFSFSGLKTAVLYKVRGLAISDRRLTTDDKRMICYEFEEAVVDVLLAKTKRAIEKYHPRTVIVAGGVSANQRLRERFTEELLANNQDTRNKIQTNSKFEYQNTKQKLSPRSKNQKQPRLLFPPMEMTGDNAAMIGLAAYYHILRGDVSTWDKVNVDSNLKL